jgi:aspartyl-tRNA(Asn)/glutamyl-tRNA(Gln) amidotransferase subunit A
MATLSEDIFFEGIASINAKWKAKEFSAVELARACSDRLERLGPRYNGLALSLRESANRKAREVDAERKRERFRGPLQAVPFAVKDLLAVEGQPTTWGAKPYAGQVFDDTATVVQKLNKTGGLLMGKLAMVELAGGPSYRYASASLQGPGLNPWDRTRWSGGSSSGSGIAVAAGLVPFALGSETSGSILTPSAFCGVTGLRPTYGLVSRYGAMALSWTLDKIGPLCRSAEDCAIVLQAISGGDSDDPGSAGKSFYYAPQFARAMKDITVGFAPIDFTDWAEPEARPDLQRALDQIRGLGVQVRETRLPEFPYGAMVGTIIGAEASSIFEDLVESGQVDSLADQKQIAGLKAAAGIPARDYLKAMRIRSLVQQAFRELFSQVDVLITPSRFGPAPRISDPLDRPRSDRPRPQDRGMSAAIPAGNLAGLPALSLPCGFAENLPLGISLVGRPFSEGMLIALGREYQSRTDWHKRRPPLGES